MKLVNLHVLPKCSICRHNAEINFPGRWLLDLNESLIPIEPGNCCKQRWKLAQNRKLIVVRSVCKCNSYFSESQLSQLGGALKELYLLQN